MKFIIYMSIMLVCTHIQNGVSASEPKEACTCSGLICKARPQRRFFREEDNPYYKRYIYVENGKGGYERIDITAGVGNATQRKYQKSDVEYDLYTRNNTDSPTVIKNGDVTQLRNSNFDPSKMSIFVCHGHTKNRTGPPNPAIKSALFDGNYDVNLFIIDWSTPANQYYVLAARDTLGIGKIVGEFINNIQSTYGINGSSFVLIGFSLGAHVVGSAGDTINSKVANMIALDPAGPLFALSNILSRYIDLNKLIGRCLRPADAQFVQVIHTARHFMGAGMSSSIGDVDYFPNNGMHQPGCQSPDRLGMGQLCSHHRAWEYLAEALRRGPVFRGVLCSDYETFKQGRCANNPQSIMGELIVTTKIYGEYYLDTNSEAPFGRG